MVTPKITTLCAVLGAAATGLVSYNPESVTVIPVIPPEPSTVKEATASRIGTPPMKDKVPLV